jgi:hypothetical protein
VGFSSMIWFELMKRFGNLGKIEIKIFDGKYNCGWLIRNELMNSWTVNCVSSFFFLYGDKELFTLEYEFNPYFDEFVWWKFVY